MSDEYGLLVTAPIGFEQAVVRTRLALRSRGFSILSEMKGVADPSESTGRRHLFMALWEYLIATGNLGGPGLDVGDHLACNVVVFEEGDSTSVAVLDPTEGLEGWQPGDLAVRARTALEQVLEDVATPAEE